MKFTPDQQRVIDLRKCNILVSAAAGSGKTAVLVQRIVELVCDPAHETDIDRLLVVTFTNAAAAQMRERITKALTERSEAEPENGHLKKQLTLIHHAKITTIHSFCLYLIKNHFNDIGLDPDFRTADEGEMRLLRQDVLKELLEEQFAQGREEFTGCVEYFAYDGREKRLEELIGRLYDFSMSHPFPEQWLAKHQGDYAQTDWEAFAGQEWFGLLFQEIGGILNACRTELDRALKLCDEPDGPYFYAAALESDRELTEKLFKLYEKAKESRSPEDFSALAKGFGAASHVTMRAKKDESVSGKKREKVKEMRQRVKDLIASVSEKYVSGTPESWLADAQKVDAALKELVRLTLLFWERLDEKKREKNLLDFGDMEHMALRILLRVQEDGSVAPSPTALEYRNEFDEILIDEYQDSNLVQEYLLQSISGEDEGRFNRFMVGDVKQSIYKFRLARPELFMEKFDAYQKEGADCIRVDLKRNFRSRRQVTDCVNDLFLQLMHRELGGVEYDADAALYPAAVFPEAACGGEAAVLPEAACGGETGRPGGPYEPELLIASVSEGSEEPKRLEARMIAGRIKELVGKFPVRDSETGALRAARYQDIVILLRTTSNWDEEFKKVLEENGIPVFVTSKTGYFAATEVQTVLNFLRVLNNPLQEIPLFGILKSPVCGFSDGELAKLRTMDETGKRRLYDCVKMAAQAGEESPAEEDGADAGNRGSAVEADAESRSLAAEADAEKRILTTDAALAEKCRRFLDFLNRFRSRAVYLPIHKLMEEFLEETGYLYTVSALPGGAQRRINVEMLLARAESFEKTSYSGLFHFIRYMEQLEKYDIDYGETGGSDENADVVRIMSIHKSKGLEFPICFAAGLSKKFNRQDSAQPVLMDMDLGLAADWVDTKARVRRSTLKKNLLAGKLSADSLGEELRVLYVALTRAEEKLILTGTMKAEKAQEQAERQETGSAVHGTDADFSPVRLQEAGSFLDIVLPAWNACGRMVCVRKEEELFREELGREAAGSNSRQKLLCADGQGLLESGRAKAFMERLQKPYAHEALSGLFVKTTVSELKKAGMREELEEGRQLFAEEEVVPYVPDFVQETEKKAGGTACGNAYHRLMERFPFGRKSEGEDWSISELRALLQEKTESGELARADAEAINPYKIRAFLETALAGRMAAADKKKMLFREQPFVLGIPASRMDSAFPEEETVLIQGIIDVFFEEEDGLVLMDYKTDRVSDARELAQRYRVQLDYYEQALSRLTGKRVKQRLIYSFALEKEIEI